MNSFSVQTVTSPGGQFVKRQLSLLQQLAYTRYPQPQSGPFLVNRSGGGWDTRMLRIGFRPFLRDNLRPIEKSQSGKRQIFALRPPGSAKAKVTQKVKKLDFGSVFLVDF